MADAITSHKLLINVFKATEGALIKSGAKNALAF